VTRARWWVCRSRGAEPPVDDRDRELKKLRAEKDRLEKELAKARFVIEVQGKVSEPLEKLSEGIMVRPAPNPAEAAPASLDPPTPAGGRPASRVRHDQ